MTTLFQAPQASASTPAPMQPLSSAEILQIAGGGITMPELLTAPADTETNQMVSPEL
jgi:hypothetical protein